MANYDKNIPIASETLRKSQPKIKDNFTAIEDAFGAGHEFETDGDQTGKHLSPIFKDVDEPDAPTGDQEVKLYNDGRILYTIDDESKKRNINKNTDIPSGTKMLFKQGSAPSGWTFKSEDNDRVLINSNAEGDGGQTGGDWTISGLSISVGGHALTVDELPAHSHKYTRGAGGWYSSSGTDTDATAKNMNADKFDTDDTGGGNSHSHSGSYSHDGNWRPQYVKVITCEKD